MPFSTELSEELNILSMYNLHSVNEGIKVHTSADAGAVAAAKRLFDKGLIDQEDGGYLTSLGVTAANHAQDLILILKKANS